MKPYKNQNVFWGGIYAGLNKGQISKAGTRICCETKSRLGITKVKKTVYKALGYSTTCYRSL